MKSSETPVNLSSSFVSLDYPCDQALVWVKKRLSKANLRFMQTFDLQSARHTPENCCCPHHGTKNCDCQMVILLIYTNANEPAALILHGDDEQTWISIADNPQQRVNAELISSIQQALEARADVSAS